MMARRGGKRPAPGTQDISAFFGAASSSSSSSSAVGDAKRQRQPDDMDRELDEALHVLFGHASFRGTQREIIRATMLRVTGWADF